MQSLDSCRKNSFTTRSSSEWKEITAICFNLEMAGSSADAALNRLQLLFSAIRTA
jgi:hypothetical protein